MILLILPFVFFQYNEELHYVESCLNGTLVQADVTNKDVSLFFFVSYCFLLLQSIRNNLWTFVMEALARFRFSRRKYSKKGFASDTQK